MPNPLSPVLRPLGLDPSQGYDTAAAGAKQAQGQANALSDLQWNRQMGGLQQAQGYTNQLQSLYNSLYGGGGGQAAPGGLSSLAPPQASMPGAGSSLASIQAWQAPKAVQNPGATGWRNEFRTEPSAQSRGWQSPASTMIPPPMNKNGVGIGGGSWGP